ncbi:MAG: alpha-2-macroglobulin family protein [Bacteroidota bacterium]
MKKLWIAALFMLPYLLLAQVNQYYFFQIPPQEIEMLLTEKHYEFEKNKLTKPVKVEPQTQSGYRQYFNDSLSKGYYLISSLNDREEKFSFYHHTDFGNIRLQTLEGQRYLYIPNKRFRSDSLAVQIGEQSLDYAADWGLFRLGERSKSGVLRISSPAETIYLRFETSEQEVILLSEIDAVSKKTQYSEHRRAPKEWKTFLGFGLKKWYLSEESQGYLALNQPLYRPGDSLKLKAYILDGAGAELNENLNLQISPADSPSEAKLWANISPKGTGIYTFTGQLGDSLRLDRSYTLFLQNEAGQTLVQNHFKLEDYLLNEFVFSFFREPSSDLLTDSSHFIFKARTENDLPVPGVRVFLEAKLWGVRNAGKTPIYAPIDLIDTLIDLPPSGFYRLSLPPQRFPALASEFQFTARFVGTNGEQSTEYLYIIRRDSLSAKDSNYQKAASAKSKLSFKGHQKTDSAFFELNNPQQTPILYRIYRDHQLMAEGISKDSLNWQWAQEATAFWQMWIEDTDGSNQRKLNLSPSQHLLRISLQQADTIKPGQRLKATIKVTDHLGNPVPDTDLTVWGINGQFKESNVPELPYLGPQLLRESTQANIKTDNPYRFRSGAYQALDRGRAQDLGLLTRDYYQLYYPDSIVLKYYPIADTSVAMYAPFVFDSLGKQQQVHFIWQDSVIKYYWGANPFNPYCIYSKTADTVDLDLRLRGELLHLPGIILKKGYKLELSINRDQLPQRASLELRPDKMTLEEARIVNQYFTFINPDGQRISYLWQKGWSYPIKVEAHSGFLAGPFSRDSLYILYPGHYGRKIAWNPFRQYKVGRTSIYVQKWNGAYLGEVFSTGGQSQTLGQVLLPLDSLDFTTKQYIESAAIPDLYDRELFWPYMSATSGLGIYYLHAGSNLPQYFVIQAVGDSLNRYVKPAGSSSTSWTLPPGNYQLNAHFADSLCLHYANVSVKADSFYIFDLAQLQGDTLAKNQWLGGLADSDSHQAWSDPLDLNYSMDRLGKSNLSFRILDTLGQAVAQAKVWVNANSSQRRVQISDAKGWVHFPHMSDSDPQINIYHPDFRVMQFRHSGSNKITLQAMPAQYRSLWQAALNAPHQIKPIYYGADRYKISYLSAPLPYIPDPALFYQDTISPIQKVLFLDSAKLPIIPPLPPVKEIDKAFPDFTLPPVGAQWGISSTIGFAQMQGILNYERGAFTELSLWYKLNRKLQLNLSAGLERQYASAQRGPTYSQNNSLWEDWYGGEVGLYPAIRRDRWSTALQVRYAPIQNYQWELSLGLGAGIMGGRVAVDARRDGQLYDYQEILARDQGTTPLSNQDRRDILGGIRDESYESIYPLQKAIAPYALASAQLSYRLAPRLSIYASYQFQLSGLNTWDTELGSYSPLNQGPSPILRRRWHQQAGLGVSIFLTKATESLWWENPISGYYSDLADTRTLINSLTEDSDNDGVPDLYDKEPDTPQGFAVNPSGRALDSDRDGIPDVEYAKDFILLDDEYKPKVQTLSFAPPEPSPEEELFVMNEELSEALRQDFRDAAFWEPDLRTDANGEVSFVIQYPDDITAWHCYVLAMNQNRQSGYLKDTVKVQAPLIARLDLPQTLRVGDRLEVQGRVQSLADSSQQIYTRFLLGDSLFEERSVVLDDYWTERQSVQFADTGTYQIAYVLRDSSGFNEGELRELAVIDNAITEQKGSFLFLEGDSSLSMPSRFAASQNVQLIAYHQPLDFLQTRMDWLLRYPYGCNEQLASRLIAVHLKALILSDADSIRLLERRKKQIIRKLEKAQNANGSWGWWTANQGEEWMSLYILKALQATQSDSKAIAKGQAWLGEAFRAPDSYREVKKEKEVSLKLALYLLQNELISATEYQLPPLDSLKPPPDVFTRLLRLAIRQELGEKLGVAEILQLSKRDVLGGRYWSARGWRWYGSQMECTALAYELIEQIAPDHRALAQTRQFLLSAEHAWQNQTVETARMLQVLVGAFQVKQAHDLLRSPKLQIAYEGESWLYDTFPQALSVPPTGVSIRKEGTGSLLLSFSQSERLQNAPSVDSLFKIRTDLIQADQQRDSLVRGESVSLQITVEVKYQADHLMLEVPIPAGCTYSSKPQSYGEAYREYRRDRTNIYLRSLAPGFYTYEIPLESRFSGEFQLMPAKIELMYVPTQFGRNELQKVQISD